MTKSEAVDLAGKFVLAYGRTLAEPVNATAWSTKLFYRGLAWEVYSESITDGLQPRILIDAKTKEILDCFIPVKTQ